MARVFIDGFDHGSLGLWDSFAGVTLDQTSKVTGIYSAQMTSGYESVLSKTISAISDVYMGLRIYYSAGSAAGVNLVFKDGSGNSQGEIDLLMTEGSFTATIANGDGATQDSGVKSHSSGAHTYHVQVHFSNTDNDDKAATVKLDNIELVTASWTNSSPDATTTEEVEVEFTTGTSAYVDDVVIDNSEWPGAPYVYVLQPDADGVTNDWSPSTGSDNYAVVDEIPASTTDYVETDTDEDVDLYTFENLPDSDDWTPLSVQVSAYAMTPGPPANEYLKLAVRVSGTNYYSDSHQLSTGYGHVSNIWDTNPASGEWTEFLVNNLEAGVQCEDA